MSADAASSLHLAILRRNARFRAWRSAGVPVEGGWEVEYRAEVDMSTMRAVSDSTPVATLRLRCGRCGRGTEASGDHRSLEDTEARAVQCSHLAPLLGSDPPEVVATTELEMLAG